MVIVNVEAVSRYLLGRPTTWVFDISCLLLLVSVLLALAYINERRGHIRLDLVLVMLPVKCQRVFETVASICLLVVCLVVTWVGVELVLRAYTSGYSTQGGIRIPLYIPMIFIPIGFALWGLQEAVRIFRNRRSQVSEK